LTHIFAVSSVDVYYKEDMGLMHSTIAPKVKAIFATEMELLPGDMHFEPDEILYQKNPSNIYSPSPLDRVLRSCKLNSSASPISFRP